MLVTIARTPTRSAPGARGRSGLGGRLRKAERGPGTRLYGPGMAPAWPFTAGLRQSQRTVAGRLGLYQFTGHTAGSASLFRPERPAPTEWRTASTVRTTRSSLQILSCKYVATP